MYSACLTRNLLLLALGTGAVSSGCQDGPIPENRGLNPWARQQWEEDEKLGPTYYKRQDELAIIRAKAGSLSPAERNQLSQEILDVYSQEPSPAMQSELVRTLGYLPTAAAQAGLLAALAHEDPDVRIAACQGLSRIQSEEARSALAKSVETDEDHDVRIAAARALGSYRDPAAVQSLGMALEDEDPAIQKVAIESLRASTGRDYGNSVPAWKEYLAGGNPAKPPGPTLAERVGWPWF